MPDLLTPVEIAERLGKLECWEWREGEIVRLFKFRDFAEALRFVNRVGTAAEAANHHPDIDIRWNKVLLRLATHSAGGITEADFSLARDISGLVAD